MDEETILRQLEDLAVRLGMTIRNEPLTTGASVSVGGYCRIRGRDFVIVNKKATTQERIHVMLEALKRQDLSDVYILPSLRMLLEEHAAPSR